MIEITVKVSNDEKSLKKKILHEGELHLSRTDPFIRSLIEQAIKEFQNEVDDHKGELHLSRTDPFRRSLIDQAIKESQNDVDDVTITCRMHNL